MHAKRFTEWVNLYSDRLYRYIIKSGVAIEEAKDMVQNSFEALWKKELADDESAGKYLFGVAHNQIADYFERKSKRKYTDVFPNQSTSPSSIDIKSLLYRELNSLSTQARQLILLKDLEGYSYAEIAEITSLSTEQVKVYLHRARLQIKSKLGAIHKII
jgi:RNA polymerase sigma factor (sigma-70 family)